MNTIEIPVEEYQKMQEENLLLKDQSLLLNVNKLVDLLYESKYGLYLGDFTDDITTASSHSIEEWKNSGDIWNDI